MTRWASSASAERVDHVVSRASAGLATWLARSEQERVAAVRSFVTAIATQLDESRPTIGATVAMHPTAEPAMRRAIEIILSWCDSGIAAGDPAFRPGIVALMHEREQPGFDHRFPCAIFAALLTDSVVVVRSNGPFDILLPPVIDAAEEAHLPAECVWWLHGDDEAVDALVSSPSVSTVLMEGTPARRARIERLGRLFDTPVLTYRDDPRFT